MNLPVVDPWKHRSKGMSCATCMCYVPKEATATDLQEVGRCRRHAPTMQGYPVVFRADWCYDHKLDENKAPVQENFQPFHTEAEIEFAKGQPTPRHPTARGHSWGGADGVERWPAAGEAKEAFNARMEYLDANVNVNL